MPQVPALLGEYEMSQHTQKRQGLCHNTALLISSAVPLLVANNKAKCSRVFQSYVPQRCFPILHFKNRMIETLKLILCFVINYLLH